jgi:lysophospholipase L1-like esterase
MSGARLRRGLGLAALLAGSASVALLLAEVALRLLLPSPEGWFVFPPGLRREFTPREEIMPGVRGVSRFIVNSQGLRGDEPDAAHTQRILAVGGSTTQCLYLDQGEAWPARLQQLLDAHGGARGRVWVGNAGKAGRRLAEYRLQLEVLLAEHPELDTVVVLVGANDVNRRLNEDAFRPVDLADPEVREALLERVFDVRPRSHALFPPRRTAVWGLVSRVQRTLEIRRHWAMIEDEGGGNYEIWRRRRAEATRIRERLPELGPALAAYAADLGELRRLAHEHGVRPIFMTQPSIYRPDLPAQYVRLLWMGWVGERQADPDQEYYSVPALAEAYAAFNRTLLGFCRESGAECLDLDPLLPKDTRSFYDDIHFNEAGAEAVARALFDYLAARPPFLGSGGGAVRRDAPASG